MQRYKKILQFFVRRLRAERGSTLVYGALALIGILAVSSLAIDGSNAYLQRREMQTAADAAALAGAHVLASGGSNSQVTQEVNAVAQLNEAAVESLSIEDGNTVRVTVETTVQTYLAQVVDVDSLQAKASAAAQFDPIPSLDGPPPICFDASCVEIDGPITIQADEVKAYCADSFQHYYGGPTSGLFIHTPEPENPLANSGAYSYDGDFREFARVGEKGTFEEYSDGTARVKMKVQNSHDRGFEMDLRLSGRTSTPPNSNSPYLTNATKYSDVSKWHYYSEWAGDLTGLPGTMYEGAEVSIYGAGAAFQVGKGATYYRGDLFGAAGWAWVYVTKQPTTGVNIFEDGWSAADVYFHLSECDYLVSNTTSQDVQCKYRWLDFNGDMSSSRDVADYINNSTASGLQQVGNWITEGPWDNNTQPIRQALSSWAGETVPVAVCGEENNSGEYQLAGFTGFTLNSLDFNRFPKTISGRFDPIVVNSTDPASDVADFMARDIHLIK